MKRDTFVGMMILLIGWVTAMVILIETSERVTVAERHIQELSKQLQVLQRAVADGGATQIFKATCSQVVNGVEQKWPAREDGDTNFACYEQDNPGRANGKD